MLAAELAAAMNALVCEQTVIDAPHCHCDEIDNPTEECPRRESSATPETPLDENAAAGKSKLDKNKISR
jgi:hypothetical protein